MLDRRSLWAFVFGGLVMVSPTKLLAYPEKLDFAVQRVPSAQKLINRIADAMAEWFRKNNQFLFISVTGANQNGSVDNLTLLPNGNIESITVPPRIPSNMTLAMFLNWSICHYAKLHGLSYDKFSINTTDTALATNTCRWWIKNGKLHHEFLFVNMLSSSS